MPTQDILFEVKGYKVSLGSAKALGPTYLEGRGTNFAVYSPYAEKVELCLFDKNEEEICRITMPGKKGRVWHAFVHNVKPGQLYGYRVVGQNAPEHGLFQDNHKLLIDPYAKGLNRPVEWNERLYQGDSQYMVPKCIVQDECEFDWQGAEKPYIPDSDTVLYELHVKGFTQVHPQVKDEYKGTYLGLVQPKVIKYLQQLGVTSLQLMPVMAFMSEPRLAKLGLVNYWGYNPINFFTPDPRYAAKNSTLEFKTMVRELHKAGIEVILDVVFNHSAEGGFDGPILSFKGFDNRNFYMFEESDGHKDYCRYVNNTGCGNSINLDNPYVLQLVTQSLRYWVEEMQVDGFRFDLAVSLAREGNDFDNYSAFFKVLFQDPVLSQVKLIAEPWDIGWGGYRLGQFPENWHECNDKFRDTVRGFWAGQEGLLPDFATRLMGSRDVFLKGLRSINTSVNYIAYHDGFTLHDLVSYNNKHNDANGEQNRDGHGHNLSNNYGVEGPTEDKKINKLRQKQKRNLLATLFLSQGTPHFLAGDEIGRTQLGNNNAYCQDNAISWLNWQLNPADKKLLEFVKRLINLRHGCPLLHSLNLEDDGYYGRANCHKVCWFNDAGELMRDDDWHNPHNAAVAVELSWVDNEHDETSDRVLILFNASHVDVHFKLPQLPDNHAWSLVFDTATEDGLQKSEVKLEAGYWQEAHSLSFIVRRKQV
ncbi:glycogen debranching protein GlgX [Catenovulum agarivorans DS-2]|uniref:Glycogen debranching protein GlgX n=1 Tax=Catenovulum agarivorans DS-2 TaxID=1328313 RepID=W7QTF4_9ALTE|nr:glycogen debranching protein GlgX [Catenovulum agarivorans]EWH12317.1 glycogen debranching protein GlgX [Catenovulum agarivorans DS-2]